MNTQDTRFETILESCLTDLQAGRASMQDCLRRHADYAAQLEPLLRVAARMQAAPQPVLSEAARQRIETRVQEHVRQLPPRRVAMPASLPVRLSGALRLAWTVGLTVVIMSVLTGGVIRAADSLPGEPLYSFKSAAEQVEAWFTPADAMAELHLKFAERRLDEVMAQGHLGMVDDLAIIRMESEMRQAMELLPATPSTKQAQLVSRILALTRRQQIILASIKNYTPVMSQAGLDWGIEMALQRSRMLQERYP